MWIMMMIWCCVSMNYVVEVWVCCSGMILWEGNYYRWVNAYFAFYREGTLNIMLLLHWRVAIYIHYVVVDDERGKLQSKQGGLVTCPESGQGGFRVWVGWTRYLSEPIDDDMVPHAYESSWDYKSHCIM